MALTPPGLKRNKRPEPAYQAAQTCFVCVGDPVVGLRSYAVWPDAPETLPQIYPARESQEDFHIWLKGG